MRVLNSGYRSPRRSAILNGDAERFSAMPSFYSQLISEIDLGVNHLEKMVAVRLLTTNNP
jgi:hypothetical protein